jgi:hypothetical protein
VVKETEKGAFVYAVQKLEGQTVEQILQSVAVLTNVNIDPALERLLASQLGIKM